MKHLTRVISVLEDRFALTHPFRAVLEDTERAYPEVTLKAIVFERGYARLEFTDEAPAEHPCYYATATEDIRAGHIVEVHLDPDTGRAYVWRTRT